MNDLERERVVITGAGSLLANANTQTGIPEVLFGLKPLWQRVRNGQSNIGPLPPHIIERVPGLQLDGVVGALLPSDVHLESYTSEGAYQKLKKAKASYATQLASVTAIDALTQAGLDPYNLEPDRTGLSVASSTGPLEFFDAVSQLLHSKSTDQDQSEYYDHHKPKGRSFLRALIALATNGLPDETIRIMADLFKIRGFASNNVVACASGTANIFDASNAIRDGQADVMIAGGVDVFRQAWAEALSAGNFLGTGWGDDPTKASRPGDIRRNGLAPGEGAGIIILESLKHVQKTNREDRIMGEIIGGSAAIDSNGATLSDYQAVADAMIRALQFSGLEQSGTEVIIPHMASTAGDETEAKGIQIANRNGIVYPSKVIHGHPWGATGTIAEELGICMLRDQYVPTHINLTRPGTIIKDGQIDPGALGETIFAIGDNSGPKKIDTFQTNGIGVQGVIYSLVTKTFDLYSPY